MYFGNILQLPQIQALQQFIVDESPRWIAFTAFILLSLLIGHYTPNFTTAIFKRFAPATTSEIFEKLIEPIKKLFRIAGTLILLSMSLVWLEVYKPLYNFVSPFMDLAVIASLAWLASRFTKQVIRIYGIELISKLGREVDELLLVFEALVNVIIGFIAVLAFARSQEFDLIGLMASLGLVGLAVAFAAQKTLEQIIGTAVLYLDRPFMPGDYIRIGNGQLGRVESIGLRSTKIRTIAKSTLMIIPNSTLASIDIENMTMAKKVMVLLYLDFTKFLDERENALVKQAIKDGTDSLFGIDPGSTKISLIDDREDKCTRARVTFFILGSNENSIELRKRLLELANDNISKQLLEYGIDFVVQDPTIYVESPVTI